MKTESTSPLTDKDDPCLRKTLLFYAELHDAVLEEAERQNRTFPQQVFFDLEIRRGIKQPN